MSVDMIQHHETCKTYIAANCAIAIECEHGFDCCPKCDPCNCFEYKLWCNPCKIEFTVRDTIKTVRHKCPGCNEKPMAEWQ